MEHTESAEVLTRIMKFSQITCSTNGFDSGVFYALKIKHLEARDSDDEVITALPYIENVIDLETRRYIASIINGQTGLAKA